MLKKKEKKAWVNYHKKLIRSNNYPRYPSEVYLKILFGTYFKKVKFTNKKNFKILDVGCGFGNNLIPFLENKQKSYGVEIDKEICAITKKILAKKFSKNIFDIKEGHNRNLPFRSNYFDLVMTNTLHYEENFKNIDLALKEYCRVLKEKKYLLIQTTGNKHNFFKTTKRLKKNIFKIKDKEDKTRYGKNFFFFENEQNFKKILGNYFSKIEFARETTVLGEYTYDIFLAICIK